MKSVYLCVAHIQNAPGNEALRDTRKLCASVYPTGETFFGALAGVNVLTSTDRFTFVVESLAESSVVLSLIETIPQDFEAAAVTLPLSWFQPNSVVKESFPMRPSVSGISAPIVTIEMHVSDNGDKPFKAPVGQLLVRPTWKGSEEHTPYVAPDFEDSPFVGGMTPPPSNDKGNENDEYSYSYYEESEEERAKSACQQPTKKVEVQEEVVGYSAPTMVTAAPRLETKVIDKKKRRSKKVKQSEEPKVVFKFWGTLQDVIKEADKARQAKK